MGLDGLNLVLRIEREFRIEISDEVASNIVTLKDLQTAIVEARKKQGHVVDEQLVWEHLATIVSDELGVRRRELEPGLRLNKDLNVD